MTTRIRPRSSPLNSIGASSANSSIFRTTCRVYHALLLAAASAAAQPLPLHAPPAGQSKVFLVILSHHDDHTWQWGFGGTIARLTSSGWTGYYVRTTNDEKDSSKGWGEGDQINLKESREGVAHLGMKGVISLNWRNDHMDSVPLKEVRAHFILLIRKHRPDIVMTWNPWGHYDRNPDHRKVARAAGEAVWMAGLANVHPEHADAGLKPHRVPYVYYTQRSDYGLGHRPNIAVALTAAGVAAKTEAFWSHTNVYGANPTPAARRNMEEFSREAGRRAGVEFAEEFFFRDEFDHLPGLKPTLGGAR